MPRRGDICEHFNSSMFRYYLRKKRRSHKAFAKQMKVSFQVVYAWGNGTHKPTWRNMIRAAEVLRIAPRLLITRSQRKVIDEWEFHLIDFLLSPPETRKQTKHEEKTGDDAGSETRSQTTLERKLKLTAREAIEVTDRLGYFDQARDDQADDASQSLNDMLYDPLKDLIEDDLIDEDETTGDPNA